MSCTYSHPRPMVTVDIFIIRIFRSKLEILLIKRKNPPFRDKWALPGGYVEREEDLLSSAKRELKEETGMNNIPLTELGVFGDPGRDPRGRTITVVFAGLLPVSQKAELFPGDDATKARWFQLNALPDLAFDHQMVIQTCFQRFRQNCLTKFWILSFFIGVEFSATDVHKLLVTVTDVHLPESQISNLITNIPFVFVNLRNEMYSLNNSGSNFFQHVEDNLIGIWKKILTK